jgi:hypothetical protein
MNTKELQPLVIHGPSKHHGTVGFAPEVAPHSPTPEIAMTSSSPAASSNMSAATAAAFDAAFRQASGLPPAPPDPSTLPRQPMFGAKINNAEEARKVLQAHLGAKDGDAPPAAETAAGFPKNQSVSAPSDSHNLGCSSLSLGQLLPTHK